MSRFRAALVAPGARWCVAGLVLVALAPGLVDLHVLADTRGHHDTLGTAAPGEQLINLTCSHRGPVHLEAATAVVRTTCPACLSRTVRSLAGSPLAPLSSALPIARIAGTAAPATLLFSVPLEPSRGPPVA